MGELFVVSTASEIVKNTYGITITGTLLGEKINVFSNIKEWVKFT